MKKASLFEACIVVLFIGFTGLLFYVMMSPPAAIDNWELNSSGKIDYMTVGSDDMLYVFSGNNITAIKQNGKLAWTYTVPENLTVLNSLTLWTRSAYGGWASTTYSPFPIMAEDSGHVYLYAFEKLSEAEQKSAKENHVEGLIIHHASRLISLNPAGRLEWVHEFNLSLYSREIYQPGYRGEYQYDGVVSIRKHGDRIYLYYQGSEEVLDSNGRLLFKITNLSGPMAVDESGYIYGVRSYRPETNGSEGSAEFSYSTDDLPLDEYLRLNKDPAVAVTTDVVEAYYPDGTLMWSQHIGNRAVRQYVTQDVWTEYNTLPIYCNKTLYIPLKNGVAAVRPDGAYLWTCQIPGGTFVLFDLMPVDSSGNVYLKALVDEWSQQTVKVYMINPGGYLEPEPWTYDGNDHCTNRQSYVGPLPVSGKDGIVYAVESNGQIDCLEFNQILESKQFGSANLTAYDIKTCTRVWNFSVPMGDRHSVTLDEHNYHDVMSYTIGNYIGAYKDPQSNPGLALWTNETQPLLPSTYKDVKIYPGNNVTYINYYSAIYEHPVIFNRSRCIYAKGLYAVDNNGSVIWSMPVDGFIDDIATTNSTVYYATRDGRIGSSGVSSVAAGITLAALAYLFLRFFAVGAVARARSKIDKNENRVQVLRYVIDHPGASAVDLSRDLGMNSGTIRYHLFILTLNHKVVTYQDGGKYLRYFKNSGAFSPEERMFMALAKREPVRKVLEILEAKPGLTGLEISKELGISSTAAHRHIGLLVENRIIDRKPHPDRGYVYTIRDEYKLQVAMLSGRCS